MSQKLEELNKKIKELTDEAAKLVEEELLKELQEHPYRRSSTMPEYAYKVISSSPSEIKVIELYNDPSYETSVRKTTFCTAKFVASTCHYITEGEFNKLLEQSKKIIGI